MEVGQILLLQGKSLKGKNRIREHGDKWAISLMKESVQFSSQKGPWLLIVPEKSGEIHSRWIHSLNDQDFLIVPRSF